MAERSFVEEVKKLRLGAGEVFRGEGILAVTKALLESGVSYVAGYQGAPISHLMDVLADAQDILAEQGIRFENSASEATAAATLAASVNYPLRGAVTFKATVGTNVASDALANLASGGVTGGALIIVGEDYGEGSSIMQERSHAFAMKSQIWLLDPRPNLTSIVAAVKHGFELSEASNTPVMLQLRIRACHVHGQFIAADNQRPAYTLAEALENPRRDVSRIVLPPASFVHEQEKVKDRWPAAVRFIEERRLNEFFAEDADDIGIIVQGGSYNTLLRGAGAPRTRRCLRQQQGAALRDERGLPDRRQRGAALLQGQARRADGGRGAAQLRRAESRHDPAPGGIVDRPARQGHVAGCRRVHRGGGAQGRTRFLRAVRPARAFAGPVPGARVPRTAVHRLHPRRPPRFPGRCPIPCMRVRPVSAPAARSARSSVR